MSRPDPSGKAPAYQWYPGDWRRDTAVQACSFGARALWREMLDLMHDGEPYGHLTAGGVPITPTELARIVGIPVPQCVKWWKELESRKVFSRNASDVVYSRRMVRDEHIRSVRRSAGKLGGNPALLVNQSGEQKPTPATATAVATAVKPEVVAAAAVSLSVRANQGLAEHATKPQPIARIVGTSGASFAAAERILQAGVPIAFAESTVYELARTHNAEGLVRSLKYFTDAVLRAFESANETAAAIGNASPNGRKGRKPSSAGEASYAAGRAAFGTDE